MREADTRAEWVHRFGVTERFGHWWTVAMMAVVAISGLSLGDDASGPMLVVHVGAMAALVVVAAAIVAVGDRRDLMQTAKALLTLERCDREWLTAIVRHPFHRPAEPRWGMFNAGQKAMAWALTGTITALVATGLLALANDAADGLHAFFAVVLGVLLGAHVFMAVVNPSTRHALNAMIRGRVRRSWAIQHHPGWLVHGGR